MKYWTEKEDVFLEKHYQKEPIEWLVEKLGRSKNAIQWRASSKGLLIRDGKQERANKKLIINLTKKQYDFVTKNRNHSAVVRKAINLLMRTENKMGK